MGNLVKVDSLASSPIFVGPMSAIDRRLQPEYFLLVDQCPGIFVWYGWRMVGTIDKKKSSQ
jgi:hypothetical protein